MKRKDFALTIPRVVLRGEWPAHEPGNSYFPNCVAQSPRLGLVAFGYYGYLISLGYSQDGLDPRPESCALPPARRRTVRRMRAALGELCSTGLVELVENDAGVLVEMVLRAPSHTEWVAP